jgi:pSer/pThr/pTyr-binding forkhead associated (FHA) protein
MSPQPEVLGIMIPVGGGDPIPLLKPELMVGRRAICDIRLDFDNVSGKHCMLSMVNGIWYVRDLGSTNGTTVNGSRLNSQDAIMPEDELGLAGHLYTIDYVPTGPEAFINTHQVVDQDVQEGRRRHSLLELAGLDTDEDKPLRSRSRPKKTSASNEQHTAEEVDFDVDFEDSVPEHFKFAPDSKPRNTAPEDDFLKLIEEEFKNSR